MSQGVTIKGKTADGQSVSIRVNANGQIEIAATGGGSLTNAELRASPIEFYSEEITQALQLLESLTEAKGVAADLRVTVINGTLAVTGTLTAVTTVTTVTTVATLTNQAQMGGFSAALMAMNSSDIAIATGIRQNLVVS